MTFRAFFRLAPSLSHPAVPVRRDGAQPDANLPAASLAPRQRGAWSRLLALAALACAAVTAAAAPGVAQAQSLFDRSANVAVASRPHPEYDALGEHVGAFTMYPRLTASAVYDDNVYALPQKTSDVVGTFAASVEFASTWSRHAADLRLRYQRDQYVRRSDQSSNEYSLGSSVRIDVDHASAINLTLNAARLTESRTAPGAFVSLGKPVQFDLLTTGVAAYRESGRFRLEGDVNANTYRFKDTPLIGGGVFPESLRNETAYRQRARVSYAVSPNLAGFLEVAPNQYRFRTPAIAAIPPGWTLYRAGSLNSSGYTVLSGVNMQLTHLLTGEFGVGYLRQNYKDPSVGSVSGLAFNVDARYFPTQLLTVSLHGEHSIQPSGVPGTVGTNADTARVSADWEVRRNVVISPQVSIARFRYPGADRVDRRYGAGLNATYLVNRTLGVTLSYNYLKQASSGLSRGYRFDDNRLSLSVTLQR